MKTCKKCDNIPHSKGLCNNHYYEKNRERKKEIQKNYTKNNRDKINEKARYKYNKNIEKNRLNKRVYYRKNVECMRKKAKEYINNVRLNALKILGMKCVCCDITEWWNLTIDHVEPLLESRRGTNLSHKVFREIVKNPKKSKEKYQTLCFGCNLSKNKYKKCQINHNVIKMVSI